MRVSEARQQDYMSLPFASRLNPNASYASMLNILAAAMHSFALVLMPEGVGPSLQMQSSTGPRYNCGVGQAS